MMFRPVMSIEITINKWASDLHSSQNVLRSLVRETAGMHKQWYNYKTIVMYIVVSL